MALSQADLDLVGKIQNPTEREAMRTRMVALDKEAAENGLRQAEFSKKMNEVTQRDKEIGAAHQKNLDWYNKAKGNWDSLAQEAKDAKERLAVLESSSHPGSDDSNDQDEVQKLIRAARTEVEDTRKKMATLETVVTEFQTMMKEGKLLTADEVNKRGDALGAAVLDLVDFQSQAKADFGMAIPRNQFLEETQRQGGDISKAYEVITKDARDTKLRATIAAEERTKLEAEFKAKSVPYASGGAPVMGPLQARWQGKKDNTIPDDIPADGQSGLGERVGALLRAEGKIEPA